MATWRFYQGLRTEWRWYHLDDPGSVSAESDQGFAELRACMSNAEVAGFTGDAYHVQVRQAGGFTGNQRAAHVAAQDGVSASYKTDIPDDEQAAP